MTWELTNALSIVGLFVASLGLFLNWRAIKENTKTREIQLISDTFKNIKDVEKELYLNFKNKSEEEKKEWDSLLFNSIEQFAFLVNHKYLKDKKLAGFFNDAIALWYEEIFLKHHDQNVINDNKQYPEFKKLYHKIKGDLI